MSMKLEIKEINKIIRECNNRLKSGYSLGYIHGLRDGLKEAKEIIKKYVKKNRCHNL